MLKQTNMIDKLESQKDQIKQMCVENDTLKNHNKVNDSVIKTLNDRNNKLKKELESVKNIHFSSSYLSAQSMINLDNVTELNEHFDCILYPEKEEDISQKQGLTIKGSSDDFVGAIQVWRRILETKDDGEKTFENLIFKLSNFKVEKDCVKCIVSSRDKSSTMTKCTLSIFKSGTIMISRVRNQEVNAVIKFASGVFISALK